MAVKYSDATLLAQGANPPGEVRTQDAHGRVRCLTASYTFAASDDSTTSIFIGTLPIGARVLSGAWAMDGGPATAVSYNIGGLNSKSTSAMLGSVTMSSSGTAAFANTSATGFLTPNGSHLLSTTTGPAAAQLPVPFDVYINPAATVSGTPNVKIRIDYVVD